MSPKFLRLAIVWGCVVLLALTTRSQVAVSTGNIESKTNTVRSTVKLEDDPFWLTTEAYEREVFRLVLQEANKVACELHLPEKLPITEKDLTRVFVARYGIAQVDGETVAGNVWTRNYAYFVSVDDKFSSVGTSHYDEDCAKWSEQYQWPRSRIDNDSAYQLATQWLAAVHMDVAALNRDCHVNVKVNSYWQGGVKWRHFVPIYDIVWQSSQHAAEHNSSAASVTVFTPTESLVDLSVHESKYILRKPLVITNLDYLLGRTNTASITNTPPNPISQ